MMPRPYQIAQQLEDWIEGNLPNDSPANIAAALDIVRSRSTGRSIPNPGASTTITPDDIITTDGEALGPITRQQLFDAFHAWEQNSMQDASPSRSLWHYTPDYAIHVHYDPPAIGHDPHYVHVVAYHQDTRPGQEHPEDALVRALAHWSGPPSAAST